MDRIPARIEALILAAFIAGGSQVARAEEPSSAAEPTAPAAAVAGPSDADPARLRAELASMEQRAKRLQDPKEADWEDAAFVETYGPKSCSCYPKTNDELVGMVAAKVLLARQYGVTECAKSSETAKAETDLPSGGELPPIRTGTGSPAGGASVTSAAPKVEACRNKYVLRMATINAASLCRGVYSAYMKSLADPYNVPAPNFPDDLVAAARKCGPVRREIDLKKLAKEIETTRARIDELVADSARAKPSIDAKPASSGDAGERKPASSGDAAPVKTAETTATKAPENSAAKPGATPNEPGEIIIETGTRR